METRIDLKKWREDFHEADRLVPEKRAAALTALHAARAHYRGKVHGPRMRLDYTQIWRLAPPEGSQGCGPLTFINMHPDSPLGQIAHNGGTKVFELTYAQQALLFAKTIEKYQAKHEEVSAAPVVLLSVLDSGST